ncbi:hypothetical protein GCM10010413_10300 [Promicromonospora sukumoe]|uniref:Cell envelope-related Asp23 family protein n=1 Tax=Promicromonospora sukumoe TaxID=88382 RepID=A0A7W3J5N3_9MICO|nr:Asp23/Gls24 family envelope stress response protein [Promicromonospora sukumoe]MBA8806693.1 hypothetical protein [Promicromonospora sukumoe]
MTPEIDPPAARWHNPDDELRPEELGPDEAPGLDDDLDGHTIEELTDYLEAGRTPPDPSIEGSAACRIALDALARLHDLTPDLIAADTAAEPQADDGWVRRILGGIALEARSGRRIPLAGPTPDADLVITEGAVRGLVRAAENAVPGVLVGRCRFDGDVTVLTSPVRVLVDVSLLYGQPIHVATARLREEIADRLATHTALDVTGIDITVSDVRPLS